MNMRSKMQFKTQLSDLNEALALVSIVKPAADSSGHSGFLFVARGDLCYVYSEDQYQKSRVSFSISGLDSEGSFVLPSRAVAPLTCLEGEVTLESSLEEGADMITITAEGGASQKLPTLDPRSLQALDSDFESAKFVNTFHPALLRDAIAQSRPFIADPKNESARDTHKCLQIFDGSKPEWEKGNGVVHAASGSTASFFQCDDLRDHGLTLHGARLPLLLSFLSKSTGEVTLKAGERSTYFVNGAGQVIGWADVVAPAKKFDYYAFKSDEYVLRVSRASLVTALEYTRKSLESKDVKVKLDYDHERGIIRIKSSSGGVETTSPPVGVVPLSAEDSTADAPVVGGDLSKSSSFAGNFNVESLLSLVAPCKSHTIEVRVQSFPNRPGSYLLRTLESYTLDEAGKTVIDSPEGKNFKCRVTRFSTSMA